MPKMMFMGNVRPRDKPKYKVGEASGMANFKAAGTAI